MADERARDAALLAVSRIVLAVSFQDSETRYASRPREIPSGETIRRFLEALDRIIENVIETQAVLRYGVCSFLTSDTRELDLPSLQPNTVDLVVTSPPYGNANDYHLYHRFRLFWIDHDPRDLARIEIGSHLRHQKEGTGFDSYIAELRHSLLSIHRLLRPGRYAVLVLGDAVYEKKSYPAAETLRDVADDVGFEAICIIEREIHGTRRSFIAAGRRASAEKLLVLRKPAKKVTVAFGDPPYRLWPYERELRLREIEALVRPKLAVNGSTSTARVDPYSLTHGRRLALTHGLGNGRDRTWQAILENGFSKDRRTRKDPKYVTHGIHPYKGKFYPQLAKALMNLSGVKSGNSVLDPFCGSGTAILESYLNGLQAFGVDMNPLAAKIARAKVGVLELSPDIVREVIGTLLSRMEAPPTRFGREEDYFDPDCLEEIRRWFPSAVVLKLGWLLGEIRGVSEGVMRDFLEVVLSSIVRDVSQQDPSDLRIRRRKTAIEDADVFGLYVRALDGQYDRIERFWSVRGYAPSQFCEAQVGEGDSRKISSLKQLGIQNGGIDLILTSPPYATALPYIDTDRLSILLLFGMDASTRKPVEYGLVGSREITTRERKALEDSLGTAEEVPSAVNEYLHHLFVKLCQSDAGFRRRNMPALLLRFFRDMGRILLNCHCALRRGGEAMVVIGDNRIRIGKKWERIPTTDFVEATAMDRGFSVVERIDITVTTENLVHIRNAITRNVVMRLRKG